VRVEVPAHTVGAEGDVGHSADLVAAAAALDHLVSDEAAIWFARNRALVGTGDDLQRRFDELVDLGIAGVAVSQLTGSELPNTLIDSLAPIAAAWRRARQR
jgi:hypothetical protein